MIEETTGDKETDDAIAGTFTFLLFQDIFPGDKVTKSLQIITGAVSFCPATYNLISDLIPRFVVRLASFNFCFTDFEAMLKEADSELAELMNS